MMLSFLFLTCAAVLNAQMPPALVNAERAKILEGVKSVPKLGAPGPVGIWGQIAFPILSAPDKDGVEKYTTEIRCDDMKMLGGRPDGAGQSSGRSEGYEQAPRRDAPPSGNKPKPSFDDLGDDLPF